MDAGKGGITYFFLYVFCLNYIKGRKLSRGGIAPTDGPASYSLDVEGCSKKYDARLVTQGEYRFKGVIEVDLGGGKPELRCENPPEVLD